MGKKTSFLAMLILGVLIWPLPSRAGLEEDLRRCLECLAGWTQAIENVDYKFRELQIRRNEFERACMLCDNKEKEWRKASEACDQARMQYDKAESQYDWYKRKCEYWLQGKIEKWFEGESPWAKRDEWDALRKIRKGEMEKIGKRRDQLRKAADDLSAKSTMALHALMEAEKKYDDATAAAPTRSLLEEKRAECDRLRAAKVEYDKAKAKAVPKDHPVSMFSTAPKQPVPEPEDKAQQKRHVPSKPIVEAAQDGKTMTGDSSDSSGSGGSISRTGDDDFYDLSTLLGVPPPDLDR